MPSNFDRPVHCILGLPFDAVTEKEAVTMFEAAIHSCKRCFLSTPNLNFLINSLDDQRFRDSVIHSDLSIADGMPLVWIARVLNIPVRERVAGSSRLRWLAGWPESAAMKAWLGRHGRFETIDSPLDALSIGDIIAVHQRLIRLPDKPAPRADGAKRVAEAILAQLPA